MNTPLRIDAMSDSIAISKAWRYLTNAEAAQYLRLSPRTLEKHRILGTGPRFRKFGRRVLYALTDLEAWADARTFSMTCEPECSAR